MINTRHTVGILGTIMVLCTLTPLAALKTESEKQFDAAKKIIATHFDEKLTAMQTYYYYAYYSMHTGVRKEYSPGAQHVEKLCKSDKVTQELLDAGDVMFRAEQLITQGGLPALKRNHLLVDDLEYYFGPDILDELESISDLTKIKEALQEELQETFTKTFTATIRKKANRSAILAGVLPVGIPLAMLLAFYAAGARNPNHPTTVRDAGALASLLFLPIGVVTSIITSPILGVEAVKARKNAPKIAEVMMEAFIKVANMGYENAAKAATAVKTS